MMEPAGLSLIPAGSVRKHNCVVLEKGLGAETDCLLITGVVVVTEDRRSRPRAT